MGNFYLFLVLQTVFLRVSTIPSTLENPDTIIELFNDFVKEYGKVYPTPADQSEAFAAFSDNVLRIQKLNEEYEMQNVEFGLNQDSDITDSRFSEMVANIEIEIKETEKRNYEKLIGSLPNFLDWRTRRNTVGEVRNQGSTGCGWSYAASSVVQSEYSLKTSDLIQPSEEKIFNNSSAKNLSNGFEWMKTFGIPLENLEEKISISETTEILIDSVTDLQRAIVDNGPLAVTFRIGNSFRHYKSGVFNITDCQNIGTFIGWHSAVVVGYGKEYGMDHWIVKNSWGKKFGERGYFKFSRGGNLCDFETGSVISVQF